MMKQFTFFSLILLLLSSVPMAGFAQAGNASPLTVRGIVTDESGAPISGATVTAPNSGDVTNNLGEYSVTAPANGQLIFSFVGCITQTVSVNHRSEINVTLEQESQVLDDVIVIGYGTTTRRRAVGAVDQVKASQITDRSVANVTQALQGTSPSLVIQNRNFNPNNQDMNINIRGIGTMNNNTPLVVLDGIVSDGTGILNQINPQDIESISILKDAGTAAIYGSRGANGVILVTTKKGRRGQAPTVQFNAMLGVQSPKILFTPVEGYQNATLYNLALTNAGQEPYFTQAHIRDLYENGNGTFFYDEIVKPALQQSYNASVSGGSDKTTYMVSAGYFDQRSNFVGPDLGVRRYNMRSNITTEHGRFKLTALLGYTRNNSEQSAANAGNLIADVTRVPTYYYNKQKDEATGKYLISSHLRQFNSLGLLEKGGTNKYDNDFITANAALDFRVIEGLKIRGVFGAEVGSEHRYTREHQVEFYDPDNMEAAPTIANTTRKSEDWNKKSWLVNMQIMADYDRYFGKHHVSALVGGSNESFYKHENQITINYADPDLGTKGDGYELGTGSYVSPESTTRRGISSVFGRVGYDYDNKYFIEGSFRYDGTSKFAKEDRWGFFPSISLGWRLSQENFMEWWKDNMGEMKLRATFGTLGNQNVGDYQYFTTYTLYKDTYGFDNNAVAGAGFKVGSEGLKWEVTRTWNMGVDLSFFNNSLTANFDYFIRNTSDILVPPQFPLIYGTEPQNYNAGKMRTWGWELTVNYALRTGNVFQNFGLNIGDSQNKVVEYDEYEKLSSQEELWHIIRVGLPLNSYYGYKTDGYFQNWEEANSAAQFNGRQFQPGDPKYIDRNGDKVLNENDMYYLGYAFPRYTIGFNYSIEWKGVDFGLFLQGVLKRDMNVRGELIEPFHETYGYTMYKHNLDYWTPTNTDARWPRLAKDNLAYRKDYGSNIFLFSGAYVRVKNIQLGYTLPQHISKKAGMSKLRIFVNAQNPFTFSATSFVDPESTEFNSNMSGSGNSARNYPTLRYYGGGLDITF